MLCTPTPAPCVEVDALGAHAADHVEQRDGTAVTLVVDGLGQENRVRDLQARLLAYLAAHGVLDGLAVLDRPAAPGPAVRGGDPWLVIAMVEEQAAVPGHDQQHRRAPQR